MPSTRPSVLVFDFDGTLVQSAEAKRQAFFDIFPPSGAPAVAAALAREPEASRFVVIPMILAELARLGLPAPAADAAELAQAYGAVADARVARAAEMPDAGALLRAVSSEATVYVASATPHAQLARHIKDRGWSAYVREAFGYPQRKSDVVALLLVRHAVAPNEILVVGDGVSDEEAASVNGCRFHRIRDASDLARVPDAMAVSHV